MKVDFGGVEIDSPTAVVLLLDGIEVGRKHYDGGVPAVWAAFTLEFDEVVVETPSGPVVFRPKNGGRVIGTGGDIEIPGEPGPFNSLIPLVAYHIGES